MNTALELFVLGACAATMVIILIIDVLEDKLRDPYTHWQY